MPRSPKIADSLTKLLDQSSRPIYVVDVGRRIVYCNPALAAWVNLEPKRIVGRRVEFHSEEPKQADAAHGDLAPLTDLCPPPHALAGEAGQGTISCQALGGRMLHRTADFLPLGRAARTSKQREANAGQQYGVLVLLAEEDLSPQEVAAEVSGEPTADELHRTIRRFRRGQAQRYSIKSLLGGSSAMQKVRAQVEAAAAGVANTLIVGRRGSGRSHVARAIHYHGGVDDSARLIPVDCELLTDDLLDRTLDKLRPARVGGDVRPTLLLENLECMPATHQSLLLAAIRQHMLSARIIATLDLHRTTGTDVEQEVDESNNSEKEKATDERAEVRKNAPIKLDPALIDAISTITIRVARLSDRLEDLPILAQYFLEACNRGNNKQVGSLRPEALDSLALYSWPGELDQLRDVIEAAHAACATHAIASTDLPPMFFHAFRAATHSRRPPERIVLDELLAAIEKEAIVRALAQTGGNKSEAATLLGMTRPRLYRRLEQLGLLGDESESVEPSEAPEFIENDAAE
jgi:DNA-binding NtrC family response regulator